jgi:hypothetical protein
MVQNNKNDNIKIIEQPVKVYKWCWKCLGRLEEGSIVPFCCWECQQEFYKENAREIDAVWREIRGID